MLHNTVQLENQCLGLLLIISLEEGEREERKKPVRVLYKSFKERESY